MYNYPMYNANNQMYMQDLQNMRDRIDQQMRQMQNQNTQMQQQIPANINQTFQLAPNNNQTNNNELDGKYANNIDDVKNTLAIKDTLFISKDNSNLWIKKADGSIKTYTLSEVIELDEKDKTIINLQNQIKELKEMMTNAKSDDVNDDERAKKQKSASLSTNKSSTK